MGSRREPVSRNGLRFTGARIAVRNEIAIRTYYDIEALHRLAVLLYGDEGIPLPPGVGYIESLTRASPLLTAVLECLATACDLYDLGEEGKLAEHLAGAYARFAAGAFQGRAAIIGHAHIDLVWLWPERATQRKGVHTFSIALKLMERFPEYRFTQSQPYLNRFLEKAHPDMQKAISRRIREGRWELTGAFYVEADVSLPSGEALARNLLYGQREFERIRGSRARLLWIPDVFGYPACLPQLMRLAGVHYFYTTKLTWSAVTRFPHTSFTWRGIDGSEILTHLCPVGYNGEVGSRELRDAIRSNRQSEYHDGVILPQGYGDGGGGVNEEMLERARRLRDLQAIPRTGWQRTEDFFEDLSKARGRLPTFEGELYLEYHRGTYTTQGEFKRSFRALERALLAREAVRVVRGAKALPFDAWERLCFAQFHDSIPGSSIGVVYKQLGGTLRRETDANLKAAAEELSGPGIAAGPAVASVFNPSTCRRSFLVDDSRLIALEGLASRPLTSAAAPSGHEVRSGASFLDNGLVRAEFAGSSVVSLRVGGKDLKLDRTSFFLFEDNPTNFDAWDIDRHVLELGHEVLAGPGLAVVRSGKARAALETEAKIGKASTLKLRYILEADSPVLHVEAHVDWHEDARLLKFCARTRYDGPQARYGIPFGSIRRSQKPGFEREEAQWEVSGQRWAAVCDEHETEGLAVLTEAKYGFSCRDGLLCLSLLRAPGEPDPTADRGSHVIRFALGAYERQSTNDRVSTPALAESLYAPFIEARLDGQIASPFTIRNPGSLVVAAVKPMENGAGFAIRLHEAVGLSGHAVLEFSGTVSKVYLGDLFEETFEADGQSLAREADGSYSLEYTAYKILTVCVER